MQQPLILDGSVMHARLFPRKNAFRYGIYYMALPLSQLDKAEIKHNRSGALSFYDHDHGSRDGSALLPWARDILAHYDLDTRISGDITLICMPRIFGYVFNPVSFWLCHNTDGQICAVICEVHNTFGESHTYICAHKDARPITSQDVLTADKVFHVSPFLKREGHYTFRFDISDDHFSAWIDFYDGTGAKQLVTSLETKAHPLTAKSLHTQFWKHPLVTFKAIALIHWQAARLVWKGIKYISKPLQSKVKLTATCMRARSSLGKERESVSVDSTVATRDDDRR